jgi:uncharacterized protein (DUF2147 family)
MLGAVTSAGASQRQRRRLGGSPGVAAVLALSVSIAAAVPGAAAPPAIPPGVWLFDKKVAVEVYDCRDLLCGRILWLIVPRDGAGELVLDRKNPDRSLQDRKLCGLTIIWGLKPLGENRWGGGKFYNPDDGKTYNVVAALVSDDLIIARLFESTTLLGQNKTLERVAHGTSDGWC